MVKGMGVTPLMAKPGTKNLVTASMKLTSATTVGRCKRSFSFCWAVRG